MKDTLVFPVVGTKFTESLELAKTLTEGVVLTLQPEPENSKDPNAIKVLAGDNHIGYVPNQGVSCSMCWTPISPTDQFCKGCGALWEHFVPGGLALRLHKTKLFDKAFACFVTTVDPENQIVIKAKLIRE